MVNYVIYKNILVSLCWHEIPSIPFDHTPLNTTSFILDFACVSIYSILKWRTLSDHSSILFYENLSLDSYSSMNFLEWAKQFSLEIQMKSTSHVHKLFTGQYTGVYETYSVVSANLFLLSLGTCCNKCSIEFLILNIHCTPETYPPAIL